MKRFIKTVSAFALTMAMVAPAFAAPVSEGFNDIDGEDFAWAKTYINNMANKGLISGYEDGTFRPDNSVTRLEALSLFARAMGSTEKVNKPVLEIAHEKYDSIINKYALKWGEDEIAYLMYKGALKKTDLDTYLKDREKDTPMKRYEAAVIITKAMGGEEAALAELGVVLDYSDAREVPSNAIQYVAYATDAGIMEGMGEDLFSPNTEVKRSQMAVMLSRTVDKTKYTFEKSKIVSVDTTEKTITAKGSDGLEESFVYTEATKIRNMGDEVQPKAMDTGVDAILTLSSGKLVSVDTISSQPDQTIKGKFQNIATISGVTSVRIIAEDETEATSYECDEDVSVTYDNTPATLRSFTKNDIITIELVNGKIANVVGESKTTTITSAVVESLDIDGDITITISHGDKDYNGKTYSVSNDVIVKKNDTTIGLDDIYKGDKVSLTLEYGKITKINATSSTKVVEGTIQSLTIATQSEMVVKVKGDNVTYQIPIDVTILVNGEEGSLYDFRVGDAVKITVESEAITKIVASTTQVSAGSITGVVTAVNSSFGVINVVSEGGVSESVFCKDDTTTFITEDGKAKKMKDIAVGQTVDVRGNRSNGVFVGKLVVIVSEG